MPWQCPECKSVALSVAVTIQAILTQSPDDENFETEAVGDHEWDAASSMTCTECNYCDNSAAFEVNELGECEGEQTDAEQPLEAPTEPCKLITLNEAGIVSGFYFNRQGDLVSLNTRDLNTKVRLIERPAGEPQTVQVTDLLQVHGVHESPFFADAKAALATIGRDYPTLRIRIARHTLPVTDALRMAAAVYVGLDYLTEPSATLDELSLSLVTDALKFSIFDLCDYKGSSLDFELTKIDVHRNVLRIDDTFQASVPTMMGFTRMRWIAFKGRFYSIDTPDGVDALRDLPVYRRAALRMIELGYMVIDSLGPFHPGK
jgi:hypothetical protein